MVGLMRCKSMSIWCEGTVFLSSYKTTRSDDWLCHTSVMRRVFPFPPPHEAIDMLQEAIVHARKGIHVVNDAIKGGSIVKK